MAVEPSSMVVTGPGCDARAALWAAVAAAKEADPLAPVTVVVPSPYAALSLRRELPSRVSGFVNVHFVAMNRLAELLGAPSLSETGRRPLDTAAATEATRLALSDVPTPGLEPESRTVAAVNATLRDAIRAGVTPHGPLARIYEAGRARVAGYYDDEDQLYAASRCVTDGAPGLDDVGRVVWFLPHRLTPGTTAFVRALADADRLRVVAARTGDVAGDRVIDDVTRALGCSVPPADGSAAPPTATRIVVAPDHDTEVRAIAQEVLALAADGVPFHRMTVTYVTPDPYDRLVHERLTGAGIPLAGPSPERLCETVPGRVLVTLLRALDDDLGRDTVVDLLTCAPLHPDLTGPDLTGPDLTGPDPTGRDLAGFRAAARWDAMSAQAGVASGAAAWRDRLSAWASRADSAQPDDPRVADAAVLAELVAALVPTDHTWTGRVEHATGVLDRLLGDGVHLAPNERDALAAVHDTLASLARLDALGGDGAAFADTLTVALDAPFGRTGLVGTGVLVAPMGSLRGTTADAVFVLGLSESATASGTIDDPLLPGYGLVDRRRTERRDAYLAALASAPRRIVSFSRADLRAARAVMPSPWLLESARRLSGRSVSTGELLAPRSPPPWLRSIASLEELVAQAPPGPGEAALATLLGWRQGGGELAAFPFDGKLRVAFEALAARRGERAGPWDGVIGPIDGLAPDDARPFSATRLETWALCPFRYFMRSVLGTDELERPETLDRIEPRVKGSLVHEALREFLSAHLGKPPSEPWSSAERSGLAAIVARHADDAERRGLVGRPALWAIDRRRLLAEAGSFLDVDQHLRATRGVSPWLQEVGFGDDEADQLPPLDLDLGDRRVRFRGRIDRIDRSPDATRVDVYDYKTGRPQEDQLVDDPVAAGTLLQPTLYGLVARREMPEALVASHYWFTRAHATDGLDGVEVDDVTTRRLEEALTIVTEAVTEGCFPRDPGADGYFGPEHCQYCAYDRACPSNRVRVAEARSETDPGFRALRTLRDRPIDDGDGES